MSQVFYILLASTSAALLTYYMQSQGISAVLSSCMVGILGAIVARLTDLEHIDTAVFTGTFVGMTSLMVLDVWGVGIAGLISGCVYIVLTDHFVGMGGKLGSMAFVSVAIVLIVLRILRHT